MAPIEQLAAPYDGGPTRARILRYRRLLGSRLISLGITVVLMVVIGLFIRDNLTSPAVIASYAVVLAIGVALVGVTYVLYRRAQRPLATLGEGTALRIDRRGLEFDGQNSAWPDVIALAVRPGGWGFSPVLELTRHSGAPVRLPLDQIGALPATIDSVVRAYSGGRHGVDLGALDN